MVGLLEQDAPLVAVAVNKAIAAGEPLPNPADCLPGHAIRERKQRFAKRQRKQLAAPPEENPNLQSPSTR